MAEEKKKGGEPKKLVKRVSYAHIQKLTAAVSLLAFVVVIVAGVMAQVRVTTMIYRALIVIVIVGIISRVIIKILATYEEMNSGQA